MQKHRRKKKRKSRGRSILFALAVLLIGMLGLGLYRVQNTLQQEVIEGAGTSDHADHSSEYIVYQDEQYPVIRHLSTVLLIGTDNFTDTERYSLKGFDVVNRNTALADFLVILVFDHDRKTVTPLQINRDIMCNVPWLDERGKIAGVNYEQITFAHMYGSGKEDSCINTITAVRNLICQAPVEHYLAFTMDAVPLMNDLVGGVTITLNEDIPDLGQEYVKGASITLKGPAALRFVRYREKFGGSNFFRMRRHRDYLNAFTLAARETVQKNQDLAVEAFKLVNPFLCTDLTVNNISELVEWLCEYEIQPTLSPSADIVPGEKYYEAYVHEESLWSCVYQAYCRKE